MGNFQASRPSGGMLGGGILMPILIGAVLAQMLASAYLLYQVSRVQTELVRTRADFSQTRERLQAEVTRVQEMSAAAREANQSTVAGLQSLLRAQLEAVQKQSQAAVGKNKDASDKRAEELRSQLKKIEQDQGDLGQKLESAAVEAKQAKTDADAAKTDIGNLATKVDVVQSGLETTKSDVVKQAEVLQKAVGDLSKQSETIARNHEEVEQLKAQGDRDIKEFALSKDGNFHREGPAQIRLKSTDVKRNRYTIEVMFNDSPSERKDVPLNHLLQFSLGRDQFLNLVVNEVQKNSIVGYISMPMNKAQKAQ